MSNPGVVILVVEDNAPTRRLASETLASRGHVVIEASDGGNALRLAAEHRPSIVIQDLVLPDLDGVELARRLRELLGPDLLIIALAGFVSTRDDARLAQAGFDEVIAKPLDGALLLQVVGAALPARSQAPAAAFGAGKRLLIADDNPLQLKLMRVLLERLGFVVETAADGEAALALARKTLPDLIVSDVMMPVVDGFALAISVRQDPALRDIPVVLVTSAFVEAADRDLAWRAGANELVVRTPDLAELIAVLQSTTLGERHTQPMDTVADLDRDRIERMIRQLERQVVINARMVKRCSALASELKVLGGISEALLRHTDIEVAIDEVLEACFDAAGISVGGLFLLQPQGGLRVRSLGPATRAAPAGLRDFFGYTPVLRSLMRADAPVALPSPAVPPEASAAVLAACHATSALVVPLVHAGHITGALLLAASGQNLDDADWRAFAQGVGSQITLALAVANAFSERESMQRRALEQERVARDCEARWQALLASAPDVIVETDREGVVRFTSRALPGLSNASVIGTRWVDHVAAVDREPMQAALRAAIDGGAAVTLEISAIGADGATMRQTTRVGPIRVGAAIAGAVLIARDVSG